MKKLHLGHCLIGVAVGAVVVLALGPSASSLGFLAVVLACPLMMFMMMRMMMGGHHGDRSPEDTSERESTH